MSSDKPILTINHLVTAFDTEEGLIRAVDDVSFEVKKGQTLGIVGESGCGKSVTALSIMRLLPKPTGITESGNSLQKFFNFILAKCMIPKSGKNPWRFCIKSAFPSLN
jgi:ABC-type dipeptide/oligopeptide/nickel transport system ATPase component